MSIEKPSLIGLMLLILLKLKNRKHDLKEIDNKLDKGLETSKCALLEAQLKTQEDINHKLASRIKMLEFALRQERLTKRTSSKQDQVVDNPQTQNEPIAMRRVKPQKPNIVKFLEEIGYEDIFDTNEVKEIKEMLGKSNTGLTKNEIVLDSIHKFDATGDQELKQNNEEQFQSRVNLYDENEIKTSNDNDLKFAKGKII